MVLCSQCNNPAVIEHPNRCKEHFVEEFEQRIFNTVNDYDLIKDGANVGVAVSGGKDSLTVLTVLNKRYKVTAILIDEGIPGYREHTIDDMKRVCGEKNIPYKIYSFKDLTGLTLSEIIDDGFTHPCSVCGTLRRYLLNLAGKDFDVLATGHNADDESQAVLMNIIKGNTELFTRLGPITGTAAVSQEGFTRRIKPLYFCTEKEIMTYAFINGLVRGFNECPHVGKSYRNTIRDEFNEYAKNHPLSRKELLERFLEYKKTMSVDSALSKKCDVCGEPASAKTCKACLLIAEIKSRHDSKIL